MNWTKEEDKVIRHIYPNGSQREILSRLASCRMWRTWECVRQRAARMGVSRRLDAWSDTEDAIIVAMYPLRDRALLCQHLPGRTWTAIRARAFRLGVARLVGRWDAPDEESN